ncbi:MAG TPA: universal stress protein [Opitutaceae bacterium]|nr:universal stress protein [Opitutaceae bacterium]
MKTILVPVDLSAVTSRICRMACDLAATVKARMVLLHVVQPPPVIMSDAYAFDAGQMASLLATAEKVSARKLAQFGRACEKRVGKVLTVQRTGQPVAVILDRANAVKADYIVLGSHGHGAVYDLLMGSTTQGVLRKARCPVLVVPASAGRKRGGR